MLHRKSCLLCTTAIGVALSFAPLQAAAQEIEEAEALVTLEPVPGDATVLDQIVVLTAAEQLRQAPGVSTVTADDLSSRPPVNDLSDIIRRMPGVNLTGTSASGQRGNNRQIDIRGMGPENTLILIDGRPVLSRNSVRMGRSGERDSRGDSNWVPPEMVDRIEVLRGPAAARYGSGAAGGVVNIITKRPETLSGSLTAFTSIPQSSDEGGNYRINGMVGGPLTERLSFRLSGNYNRTDPDDPNINAEATLDPEAAPAAGREGVENIDGRALVSLEAADGHVVDFELAYSRQGNRFTGDRQGAGIEEDGPIPELAANEAETNTLYRRELAVTHRGTWAFGDSLSFIQWENTRNSRLLEGLAGGGEGAINTTERGTIILDNVTAKSEWDIPLFLAFDQVLTLGAEFRGEWMEDAISIRQATADGVAIPGVDPDPANRDPKSNAWLLGVYVEDNIQVNDRLILTPGLRIDHHSEFGANLSPSLNASYDLTDDLTLKMGVARAFKAPNLFQLNPNYVYYTMGMGCPIDYPSQGGVGCYVVGNPDLDAETSINTEIGINYTNLDGLNAGITYFYNDYKDRISSGVVPIGAADPVNNAGWFLLWENTPEAVVSGFEGNLILPIGYNLTWSTNATYMAKSENKSNGQPLSLIPEYTINSSLEWRATEQLTITPSLTHYGKTESPTLTATTGSEIENPLARDPYTLVGLGLSYDFQENYRLLAGVNNLFDDRQFRQGSGTSAGANTYNEPGRTFYLSLTANF